MAKLKFLAPWLFVLFAPGVGATPLASRLGSFEQFSLQTDLLPRTPTTRAGRAAFDRSFPFLMNLAAVSIVTEDEEYGDSAWSDFDRTIEPGDAAKHDYSIWSVPLGVYSAFTPNRPLLSFQRGEVLTFAVNHPLLSIRRGECLTFVTRGSLAIEALAAEPTAADEVLPELTELSGVDAAKALRRAWRKARSQLPTLDTLVILTAHWAHETAAGTSMFNYNFGGIKGRGPDRLSCLHGAREGFGFRTRVVRDRFRAYLNAASGADDYVSLLLRKYPTAIEAAERGDVTEFVQALQVGGYFTGSEEDYLQSLRKRTIPAGEWALAALGGSRSIELRSPIALPSRYVANQAVSSASPPTSLVE